MEGGRLKFIKGMPVKTADVDVAGDGPALGHAAYGYEPGQEEIGIGTRADERIVHGVMKSHQIQKRRDEPRSKLFEYAASEDEHFPQVYGRHAAKGLHCALPETLRPVMLRNTSSRLTLLTVLVPCS